MICVCCIHSGHQSYRLLRLLELYRKQQQLQFINTPFPRRHSANAEHNGTSRGSLKAGDHVAQYCRHHRLWGRDIY